jgi:hypothetical protein
MNASDILKYGHLTVLRTLAQAPQVEWDTPNVCGYWSVKNIVAHLASFEHMLCEILTGFLGSGLTPYLDQFKQGEPIFNDPQVDQRKHLTPAEALAEYNEMQAQVMTLAARIPLETFRQVGTLPWYGPEYALDDFIVYTFYGHKREHMAQVNVFKDKLRAEGRI